MSDLKILFPEPVVVPVGSRGVIVRPVELRHFERFSEAATALIGMISTESQVGLYAYARQSGAMRVIIGACTDLNRWQIARLPMPVAIKLMVEVIKVNSAFFDEALAAAATALAGAKSPSA